METTRQVAMHFEPAVAAVGSATLAPIARAGEEQRVEIRRGDCLRDSGGGAAQEAGGVEETQRTAFECQAGEAVPHHARASNIPEVEVAVPIAHAPPATIG